MFAIPGNYEFTNVGDVAMARVAVERIGRAIPGAEISMYAVSQQALDAHGLSQVRASTDRPWHLWGRLVRKWVHRAPPGSRAWMVPFRWPLAYLAVARLGGKVTEHASIRRWLRDLRQADLVAVCGQGAFHDGSDRRHDRLCHLLLMVAAAGIPIVALSQGLGPLRSPSRRELLGLALEGVDGVGLRDGAGSVEIVRSLGMPAERWQITGDAALALAEPLGLDGPRDRIGVSLRANSAAGVVEGLPEMVRQGIEQSGLRRQAELISMMESSEVSDRSLLDRVVPDGVQASVHAATVDGVLAGLGRCRVVISGTYHAAVFALGLGIPVVALAGNDYYRQKMNGLLDQFGRRGGTVLDPADPDLVDKLASALQHWDRESDYLRPVLRQARDEQVDLGERFARDVIRAALGRT